MVISPYSQLALREQLRVGAIEHQSGGCVDRRRLLLFFSISHRPARLSDVQRANACRALCRCFRAAPVYGAGKQPVTRRTAWHRLDIPEGGFLSVKFLKYIAGRGAPAGTPPCVRNWQRDFGYLYLIGPSIPNPMPDRLEFVKGAPRFALYRVRK